MKRHEFEPMSSAPAVCQVCRRVKDDFEAHFGGPAPINKDRMSDSDVALVGPDGKEIHLLPTKTFEQLLDFLLAQALREMAFIRLVQNKARSFNEMMEGVDKDDPGELLKLAMEIEQGEI